MVLISVRQVRFIQGMLVKQKIRGDMVDEGGAPDARGDSQAPKIADALKKGVFVSLVTWGGRELKGLICDREQTGLLLDVSESADGSEGYLFLPWSSIEQVYIQSVSPRRVKVL